MISPIRNSHSRLTKMLRTAEVAELENSAVRVEQQVLRFDVPMTDSMRMNVGKRSAENIINKTGKIAESKKGFRVVGC